MRTTILLPVALATLLIAGATLLCCNGCAGVNLPNASNGSNPGELPEDESEIQVVGGDAPSTPSPATPAPATPAPATQAPPRARDRRVPCLRGARRAAARATQREFLEELTLRGVRGGELSYELDGSVDDVVAMLLDQNGAEGHRAWARSYREVSRDGERVVGEWHFRGKMGINPVVHIEFSTTREAESARIRYKVVKRAMGVKSFFGDYRIRGVSGVPSRSRLTARVFIDSGMPFVNASHKDIQDGLREDAKLLREWIGQRSPSSVK